MLGESFWISFRLNLLALLRKYEWNDALTLNETEITAIVSSHLDTSPSNLWTTKIDPVSHSFTCPKWQVIFSLYSPLNSNKEMKKPGECASELDRHNKKTKLINNSQHPHPLPQNEMKLKALHHSILVKAEFFMRQNEFGCCIGWKVLP